VQLDIRGERKIDNPDDTAIAEAVNSLDGTGDSFVILNTDAGFIQSSCNEYGECDLEYSLNVGKEWIRCKNNNLSKPWVIDAFAKFARQDYGWIEKYEWEEEEIKSRHGCLGIFVAGFLLCGVAITVILSL